MHIMYKMTMLPVLDYLKFCSNQEDIYGTFFMQISYLDKDWNIVIFEVEFGNFCQF